MTAQSVTVQASSTAESGPQWDMQSLEELLPEGDPLAAFDMSAYLATSEIRDPLAAEADLMKLLTLLSGEVAASQPVAAPQPALHDVASITEPGYTDSLATQATFAPSMSPAAHELGIARPQSSTSTSGVSSFNKRRRQKKQQAIIVGGTVLAIAVGGLVYMGVQLMGRGTNANQTVALNGDSAVAPGQPADAASAGTPSTPAAATMNGNGNTSASATDSPDMAADDAGGNKPRANGRRRRGGSGLPQPGEDVPRLEIQATPVPDAGMPNADAECFNARHVQARHVQARAARRPQ